MVAMLFILFDVEAVFILPWAVIYRRLPSLGVGRFFGVWEMIVYLGFVAVGLFYIFKKVFSTGLRKRRTFKFMPPANKEAVFVEHAANPAVASLLAWKQEAVGRTPSGTGTNSL